MNKQSNRSKILNLLYKEFPRKRIAGVKKSLTSFDEEIIDYLILLLQIDENKKVRKAIINTFSEMIMTEMDVSLEQKINTALDSAKNNEPEKGKIYFAPLPVLMSNPTFGFMYGVAALGKEGGNHTISILKTQLQQVMEQICCEKIEDLPKHLVSK